MRRFIVLISIGTMLLASVLAEAGVPEKKGSIGFRAGTSLLSGDGVKLSDPGFSSEIFLHYNLSRNIGLQFSAGYMGLKGEVNGNPYETTIIPLEISQVSSFLPDGPINPYLSIGVGSPYWWSNKRGIGTGKWDTIFTGRVGLQVPLGGDLCLDMNFKGNYYLTDYLDDVSSGSAKDFTFGGFLGLVYFIGAEKDSDKDGIPDRVDADPYRPEDFDGFEDEDGAPDPDNDNDGIPDVRDKAPNEPEDFDGFEDEDGVPDPDNDGDGIPDVRDKAPNEPEDFDGFEDEDGAPDPDNDGDGIPDVKDKAPNEPEDFDGFEDEDGVPDPDNDGDGIPDVRDKAPNEPEDFDGFEDEDGAPDPDNDGDGIPDVRDKCPNEPETFNGYQDEDGCPDEKPKEEKVILEGVNFKPGSAELIMESYAALDKVAQSLLGHPEIVVEIHGYTDSIGDRAFNKRLSQRRAEAVLNYLVSKGLSPARLKAIGFGEENPIADNRSPEGRAKNRRVELLRRK